MPYDISNKLKIAVTTRALFKLESENKMYQEKGRVEYEKYQIAVTPLSNKNKHVNLLHFNYVFWIIRSLYLKE